MGDFVKFFTNFCSYCRKERLFVIGSFIIFRESDRLKKLAFPNQAAAQDRYFFFLRSDGGDSLSFPNAGPLSGGID